MKFSWTMDDPCWRRANVTAVVGLDASGYTRTIQVKDIPPGIEAGEVQYRLDRTRLGETVERVSYDELHDAPLPEFLKEMLDDGTHER